jgi:hypothetical protein
MAEQKNAPEVIKLAEQLQGQHLGMLPYQLDDISSMLDEDETINMAAIPVAQSNSHPSPYMSALMPNP